MTNKLWFLVKMSLKKKIKTKWFVIANIIFLILVVGLINIDSIIKYFGGDFNETTNILVIDEANVFDSFNLNYQNNSKYLSDYDNVNIELYDDSYDEAVKEVEKDKKVLLVISNDDDNYLSAKVVSKEELGTITSGLISASLNNVRSELVLEKYNITNEMYADINIPVNVETEILDENNIENGMMVSTVMQFLTLPTFMLIIFLVQMIGAEVNEEKSTKSMEIIISNVSPKTHFISKVIASNVFVIVQGALLLLFLGMGVLLRYYVNGGSLMGEAEGEIRAFIDLLSWDSIKSSLGVMLPVIIIITLLTFVAYSLLAGILASMTTNLEDFQQLQSPIVIISLAGYYLSTMAGMFKGSTFIRVLSYVPFISSLLSPTLYVLGEVTIFDLLGSMLLLVLMIFILIRYGLKIYKVGILNYSGTNLWKKMFKAVREK